MARTKRKAKWKRTYEPAPTQRTFDKGMAVELPGRVIVSKEFVERVLALENRPAQVERAIGGV